MNLVVVESPSKAKTIGKYLGKDYLVKASKGHIVDLPKSGIGVDPANNFKADYVVTNSKSLKDLKDSFKSAEKLILAVDLDREGEAIGWHIAKELKLIDEKGNAKKNAKTVERIVFNEITKDAILLALKNPRSIDINLVNAQQSRRILDRLVGYKLSPLLWKKISFGLSAGRVQSVALRLVVERESERDSFVASEYWSLESWLGLVDDSQKLSSTFYLAKDLDIPKVRSSLLTKGFLKFELKKYSNKDIKIENIDQSKEIFTEIKDNEWIVRDIKQVLINKKPKPPFITSTLQQSSFNNLGFSAKRTMIAAQKLYEAGLITYMRTDSTNMSKIATVQIANYVEKEYGKEYLSKNLREYESSNKLAQEAHECIRPTDFFKIPNILNIEEDQVRLYDLIWRRSIASQMSNAIIKNTSIQIEVNKYLFVTTGKIIDFKGFLAIMNDASEDVILPDLKVGQKLFPKEFLGIQHFTEPVARYSEATLIKKMEELGIGRPSTYASIISTILTRNYVEMEGRYLKPTDTGKVVTSLLVKYFSNIVDYDFTSQMESNLDKVANGDLDWVKMLSEFYFPFENEVLTKDKLIPRSEFTQLGDSLETCPKCGGPMIYKLGRYGKFLSCKNFPTCDGMLSIEGKSALILDESKYISSPKTEDGRLFILKSSKYGKFWAHPDYPKTKEVFPLLLKEKCPLSGHNLVERKGKWGKLFIGCSNYPNCKFIKKEKSES